LRGLQSQKLIIVGKAKQIGISWTLALFAVWHIYVTFGANVLTLSGGEKEAQRLLFKCKAIYNNLPEWMKLYTIEPSSLESFGFKELEARITALPSTEKAGIGETASLVIHDEFDFHEYAQTNFTHTYATVVDAPDRKLVIVSTKNIEEPDSFFKQLLEGAFNGQNSFKPYFFPYHVRPNRDQAWYEETKLQFKDTPWVMGKNFPNNLEEFLSPISQQSCFNEDTLKTLWENALESPEIRQGFIYILHPPRVGVAYAAAADVGEGVGLDYSCLVIAGKYGLESEVAAVIYSNTIGTDAFAFECDRLCREYFSPLLCIDNIGIGRAVLDKLIALGYPNLFYGDTKREKSGWALTRPNKRELVVKLIENINNSSLITRFKPQIKELMEYQWVRGYPEPTGKTHGDTVISLMLVNEMLKHVGIKREMHAYIRGKRIW